MNNFPSQGAAGMGRLAATDYICDIEQRRPFAYAKINHGMWDGLVRGARMQARGVSDPRQLDILPGFRASGFYDELKSLVRGIPTMRADIRFGASTTAFPDNDRWDLAPEERLAKVNAAMNEFIAGVPITADALIWKRAVIDGSIADFFRALRLRDVVLVGPAWLRHFGTFAALPRFRFVEINSRTALLDRAEIATELRTTHEAEAHTVYLIQAGPLSVWLVLMLADELPNATFVDLGMALDLCSVNHTKSRLWVKFFRTEVAASIAAINSSWPSDPRAYTRDLAPQERRAMWRSFSGGILPELAAIAELPERTTGLGDFDRPELIASGPVRYVEDKRIDWERVREILDLSRRANQWTNFGPVSQALERSLEHVLKLPAERAVVVCASASVGLTALAGRHAVKCGRRLRWLVSAYTFAVQHTGVFADATIADCDETGLLDLAAAEALPEHQWDGMIVTNLFGALKDCGRFAEFCQVRGKALIVDSAAALLGLDRSVTNMPAEVISFHHTKPWGIGEGGCVIVDREDVPLIRSVLNFGMEGPDLLKSFAGNGKISELACALILDRLERMPSWSHFYYGQRRRIDKLRRHAGLSLVCKGPDHAIAASLPVLALQPVAPSALSDQPFGIGKYYPPLESGHRNAERLFSHIVNVPVHSGMASVPTETIESLLHDLAQKPSTGLMRRLIERVTSRT
jgi:dTDP-4-amino-4,6-dideoxygalactose transaminase